MTNIRYAVDMSERRALILVQFKMDKPLILLAAGHPLDVGKRALAG